MYRVLHYGAHELLRRSSRAHNFSLCYYRTISMRTCILILLTIMTSGFPLLAQLTETHLCVQQPFMPAETITNQNGQPGGLFIPSRGLINALIVFAQFPDDSLDINHPEWPRNQPPRLMNQWVDSIWTSTPTPYSMTDYYNQMSMGQFRFIGKTRFVIAPRTRQEYLSLGMKRGDIHAELFQKLDSTLDFAEFDHWHLEDEYLHREQSDKIVDLVIVIWRNINEDIRDPQQKNNMRRDLVFPGDQTELGNPGQQLFVDNGNRIIKMWYGIDSSTGTKRQAGSGPVLTKNYLKNSFLSMMKTCIHETGHYLLGGNEYHVGLGFWGMISSYGTRSFVANSFERHRLGWITLRSFDASQQPVTGLSLPDYVTSGMAYRFVIDSATAQYFFLENHQGISRWDRDMEGSVMERGVYVLRQDSVVDKTAYANHMQLVPADGRFYWSAARKETNSCCGSILLPVLQQDSPDRHNGYHDCEHIRYYYEPMGQLDTVTADVILMEDANGNTTLANKMSGDGLDAFRMGYQQVFSPWSNPNSQQKGRAHTSFGFELTDVDTTEDSDVYTLDLYPQGAVAASPAKVQAFSVAATSTNKAALSWQANEEPDLKWYRIYRATVVSPNEPPAFAYQVVATLDARDAQGSPLTSWIDTSVSVGGQTLYRLYYNIAAIDSTDKESVKATSWIYNAPPPLSSGKQSTFTTRAGREITLQVSPNPFETDLLFSLDLPVQQHIVLQLVDLFGRTVGSVVDEILEAGHYERTFHVEGPTGTFCFYRLQSDAGIQSGLLIPRR
jgi:M6 family metalloprotease-like protein